MTARHVQHGRADACRTSTHCGRRQSRASPTTRNCSPMFVTAQALRWTSSRAARVRWRRCSPAVPSRSAEDLYERSQTMRYINAIAAAAAGGIRRGRTARSRISRAGDRRRHGRDDGGRRALASTALRLPFLRCIGLVPRCRARENSPAIPQCASFGSTSMCRSKSRDTGTDSSTSSWRPMPCMPAPISPLLLADCRRLLAPGGIACIRGIDRELRLVRRDDRA